jgi:hypothetical protein
MALAKDRLIPTRGAEFFEKPVSAAKTLYAGAIVCLNLAGDATPGATALGLKAIGRCEEFSDNALGLAGDVSVKVRSGVFRFDNSANADAITDAYVGELCYIVDDCTVALTSGGGTRSVAGRIIEVDDAGVWVELGTVVFDRQKLGVPAFVIGAEAGNVINVAVQLKDAAGVNLAVRASLTAYLATEAHGDVLAAAAPSGGVAIGANGVAIPLVAGKAFQLVSEANGTIDLNITEAGAATWYLVLVMPDGRLVASNAITFAA